MQEKMLFTQTVPEKEINNFQEKQSFDEKNVEVETDHSLYEGELPESEFEQKMRTETGFATKLMAGIALLFLCATVAQSIQWLIDTWQAKQWIYFAFALVAFGIVCLGLSALIKEFLRLRWLRQHILRRQQSRQFLREQSQSAVQILPVLSNEQAMQFCSNVAKQLALSDSHSDMLRWKAQVNESHSPQEVALLFSRNVLSSLDQQAQKILLKTAIESGVVVSLSPLAVVDMFFVAWRNIRLINQISALYGIELGYFSRLKLMKLVLVNMAFTGATELINEVGLDWLSQDITAKLSARLAQGIGVGLLTARLGIKTIEFCRPMQFQSDEKIRLRHIQSELLSQVKERVLNNIKLKSKDKV